MHMTLNASVRGSLDTKINVVSMRGSLDTKCNPYTIKEWELKPCKHDVI